MAVLKTKTTDSSVRPTQIEATILNDNSWKSADSEESLRVRGFTVGWESSKKTGRVGEGGFPPKK